MDHDSNRLLLPNAGGSQAGELQVDLLLKRATPTSVLTLRPHVGWQRYTQDITRDADYQSLQATGTWMEDRTVYSAQAAVSRDSILNSELADTGILTGGSERTMKNGAFSWSHELSDRNQIEAQLGYADIEYDTQRVFAFFGQLFPYRDLYGYRYPSASVTHSHVWSPRTTVQVTAYASELMPDDDSGDSRSFGAQFGFERSLTSRLKLSLAAGLSRQQFDEQTESGYIGRFELTRTDILGQWQLFASRTVSPSGFGALVRVDDAGLLFSRRLAPRWLNRSSLRTIRNEDIGLARSNQLARFERADTSLEWQATRTWTLRAYTAYTRAQQRDDWALARGWKVTLGATWTPYPRTMSR